MTAALRCSTESAGTQLQGSPLVNTDVIETVMFCNYCKCSLNPRRYSAARVHHYALSAVLGFYILHIQSV